MNLVRIADPCRTPWVRDYPPCRSILAGLTHIGMEDEAAPYIRFRLGNIDSYQGTPTSLDRNCYPKVPIIRIWGAADETGQKVCQHRDYSDIALGVLSCPRRIPVLLC